MNSSFWFDSIKFGIVHCAYLWVSGFNFKNMYFFLLKFIVFTYTKSVNPDEMQHFAAFHLGQISLFAK